MLNVCLIINLNLPQGFSPAFFHNQNWLCAHTFDKGASNGVHGNKKNNNREMLKLFFVNFSVKLIIVFQVIIDGVSHIVQANITAENGFVHVIDKVRK